MYFIFELLHSGFLKLYKIIAYASVAMILWDNKNHKVKICILCYFSKIFL
jgi:hypothetical protein